MKKLTNLFVVLCLMALAPMAQASDKQEAYYQVAKVSFTEVVPTAAEIASGYLQPKTPVQTWLPDLSGMDWNTMVLVGEKLIELVKAGAPVVNIKRDTVAVMPMGMMDWQQLAGWQAPSTKVYNFKVTNYLGMDVVDLRLKVSSMWGGTYAGRGQYLANVMVVPVNTRVLWGWSLDLWTEHSEPVNNGTFEAPRAGLGMEIRYRATTALNELNGAQDYFLTGDGNILAL